MFLLSIMQLMEDPANLKTVDCSFALHGLISSHRLCCIHICCMYTTHNSLQRAFQPQILAMNGQHTGLYKSWMITKCISVQCKPHTLALEVYLIYRAQKYTTYTSSDVYTETLDIRHTSSDTLLTRYTTSMPRGRVGDEAVLRRRHNDPGARTVEKGDGDHPIFAGFAGCQHRLVSVHLHISIHQGRKVAVIQDLNFDWHLCGHEKEKTIKDKPFHVLLPYHLVTVVLEKQKHTVAHHA